MTNVLFGLPQILSSFLMIIICTMTVSIMRSGLAANIANAETGLRCCNSNSIREA